MVVFLCEKCKQEASWVCLVGSREVFLCRSCEAGGSRCADRASQRLRRVALVNCSPGAHALPCGVCKVTHSHTRSPNQDQSACDWEASETYQPHQPGRTCASLFPGGQSGNAVSALGSSAKATAMSTGSQSSDSPEGFAGWPSDSEDSLLIDFSQGLTSSWKSESEFMQVNWSQGTGILKSQREPGVLNQDNWEVSDQACLGCDNLTKQKDVLHKSEAISVAPAQIMGSPSHLQDISEKFMAGADGLPTVGPQFAPISPKESSSCQPSIVPGVPFGMVPVTVPPIFTRKQQKSHVRPDLHSKPPEVFKASSMRRQCQSICNGGNIGGVDNGSGTVLQSSCEDDDELKDEGVGSGTSGSLGLPQRRCTHCGASKTPQWRAGPYGQKTLCNACGVKYKAGRLSSCSGPGGRSRKVSQISSRKMVMASQGRGP